MTPHLRRTNEVCCRFRGNIQINGQTDRTTTETLRHICQGLISTVACIPVILLRVFAVDAYLRLIILLISLHLSYFLGYYWSYEVAHNYCECMNQVQALNQGDWY